MDAEPSIEAVLARMAELLAAAGKGDWAARLQAQIVRLQADPGAAASEILALYDQPGAADGPLPTSASGEYAESAPELDAAFEYARLRWRLYQGAVDLWRRHRSPVRVDPDAPDVELLSDYGGGHQVLRRGGRYFVRYDTGAHFQIWREDEIPEADAAQAALGGVHFSNMVLALQRRLEAQGADPWISNTEA